MFWTWVLRFIFLVAGYFIGTFAFGQIVGSTIAASSVVNEMKAQENPAWVLADTIRKRYTGAIILWIVIFSGLSCVVVFVLPRYVVPYFIGAGISLVITLFAIQSYKREFMENVIASLMASAFSSSDMRA